MQYIVIEFVADNTPVLCDAAWPLTAIADILECQRADLIEQNGPTIGSTSVWDARKETLVAVYQPMASLREFM